LHQLLFIFFQVKPWLLSLHLLWSKESKNLSIIRSLSSFDQLVNIFRRKRIMESNSVRTI
jgi:hypothetical protein